jgi:integrase/recombinase XerD
MKTRQHAKTRQTALAGFTARNIKHLGQNPPTRHESHGTSLTPRALKLLGLYREETALRFSERTVGSYMSHLHVFLAWLDARGITIAAARSEDIHQYQSDLLAVRRPDGRPYSAGHQVNVLKGIKSFFGYLYRRGYRLSDAAATVPYPRVEKRLPRNLLTPDEARRILEAPRGRSPQALRDRAILETLYATGIRASELSHLTPYDADTEERVLHIVRGKGGKDRTVPLTCTAARAIAEYVAQGRARIGPKQARHLFLGDKGGLLHRAVLSRIIRHWTEEAGLTKHVTAHTFRHSIATELLRGGADIRYIQALLGHALLGSTQIYTRVEITDLQQVIARAHPRGR